MSKEHINNKTSRTALFGPRIVQEDLVDAGLTDDGRRRIRTYDLRCVRPELYR